MTANSADWHRPRERCNRVAQVLCSCSPTSQGARQPCSAPLGLIVQGDKNLSATSITLQLFTTEDDRTNRASMVTKIPVRNAHSDSPLAKKQVHTGVVIPNACSAEAARISTKSSGVKCTYATVLGETVLQSFEDYIFFKSRRQGGKIQAHGSGTLCIEANPVRLKASTVMPVAIAWDWRHYHPVGTSLVGLPVKLLALMNDRDRAIQLCLQYRLKLKNVEQKLHDVRCKASKLQQQLGDSAAGYEKAKAQAMEVARQELAHRFRGLEAESTEESWGAVAVTRDALRTRSQIERARKDVRQLWLERDELAKLAGGALQGEAAGRKHINKLKAQVAQLRGEVERMTSSTRLKDEEAKRAEARAAAAEEAEQSLRSAVEDIRGEFEALVNDVRLRGARIQQFEMERIGGAAGNPRSIPVPDDAESTEGYTTSRRRTPFRLGHRKKPCRVEYSAHIKEMGELMKKSSHNVTTALPTRSKAVAGSLGTRLLGTGKTKTDYEIKTVHKQGGKRMRDEGHVEQNRRGRHGGKYAMRPMAVSTERSDSVHERTTPEKQTPAGSRIPRTWPRKRLAPETVMHTGSIPISYPHRGGRVTISVPIPALQHPENYRHANKSRDSAAVVSDNPAGTPAITSSNATHHIECTETEVNPETSVSPAPLLQPSGRGDDSVEGSTRTTPLTLPSSIGDTATSTVHGSPRSDSTPSNTPEAPRDLDRGATVEPVVGRSGFDSEHEAGDDDTEEISEGVHGDSSVAVRNPELQESIRSIVGSDRARNSDLTAESARDDGRAELKPDSPGAQGGGDEMRDEAAPSETSVFEDVGNMSAPRSQLLGGVRVLKHSAWGKAKPKILRVTPDLSEILYTAIGRTSNSKPTSRMPLAEVCATREWDHYPTLRRLRGEEGNRCFILLRVSHWTACGHSQDLLDDFGRGNSESESLASSARRWNIRRALHADWLHVKRWGSNGHVVDSTGGNFPDSGRDESLGTSLSRTTMSNTRHHNNSRHRQASLGFEAASIDECNKLIGDINELARRAVANLGDNVSSSPHGMNVRAFQSGG